VKRIYLGWIAIGALVVVSLVLAASSRSRGPTGAIDDKLAQYSQQALAREPAAEPGDGKVTLNLSRALRLALPVLGYFAYHPRPDKHEEDPAKLAQARQDQAREWAERDMLAHLAADYKGALSVVLVTPETAPASIVRQKVAKFPTTIIFDDDNQELWRHEGDVTGAQIRRELVRVKIEPAPASGAGAKK
jgi:hypothetical protein